MKVCNQSVKHHNKFLQQTAYCNADLSLFKIILWILYFKYTACPKKGNNLNLSKQTWVPAN